jgi:hypothetical protein
MDREHFRKMPTLAIWKGESATLATGVNYKVGVMAYEYPGEGSLDYYPCRYGASRLLFRGPRRDLGAPYCVTLGGTETYGKFVPEPFPALTEGITGHRMVNLGCVNAGVDVFLKDPEVMGIAAKAQVTVVQILGAQNQTNRFYAVHPRRNDRFLHATPILRTIFREVDFTEFNFTRHMLQTLQTISADKFEVLAEELRAAWVARMRSLLAALPTRTVLLWVSKAPPPMPGRRAKLSFDPLLIDTEMIAAIRPHATSYLEVIPSADACAKGTEGMAFAELDRVAAAGLPGPAAHREIAAALTEELRKLI